MNKGFFVVFLGVVLGAMALIFVNQRPEPAVVSASAERAGSAVPRPESGTPTMAAAPQPTPPPVSTPRISETPKPEAPGRETPRPETPQLPPAGPAVSLPEVPKPEIPAREVPKTAVPSPASPAPVIPKPETPKPVVPASASSIPVVPKPETPKPATPKPETPKPTPPAMNPVTPAPETQTAPGAARTKKSLALVNIGLHFKGGGMALRIEADAPFSYKTFALPSPDRYVVDLVGTWDNMRAPSVPSNNLVKGARAGKQTGGPRLVLDMARPPRKHNVTWVTPTVLEITLE